MNQRRVAERAVAAAYRTRLQAGYGLSESLCVYDLAEALGAEVRFVDIPSLEGVFYDSVPPTVLVSHHRPAGRRRFTCAHEVGHWQMGHSTQLDELMENQADAGRRDPEERAAQVFAGALLMPKPAVEEAFAARGWSPASCSPAQAFRIAGLFGVGYEALVYQMQLGLRMISDPTARGLLRHRVMNIRAELLGQDVSEPLHVVDPQWHGRPVDAEVGDLLLGPAGVIYEGPTLLPLESGPGRTLLRAVRPGIGRLSMPAGGWAAYVRVSRTAYIGRSVFRHLPEEADDD